MPTQEELESIEKNLSQIRYTYNFKKQKVILERCKPFAQLVSDRYDIFRDNFDIFAKSSNAIMYPDEFIFAVSQIKGGSQLILDNIDLLLKINDYRRNRLVDSLGDIPGIEKCLAEDFSKRFNLLVHGKQEPDTISYGKNKHFNSDRDLCNDDVAFRLIKFFKYILKHPNALQILEENKDIFLTPRYNSVMPQIVHTLSSRPDLHSFIRNNFSQILKCAKENDIVKVYKSAQFVLPEQYDRHRFIIEEIYDKAMEKIENEKSTMYYDDVKTKTNQVSKTCSRIIQQDRSEEIQEFISFVAAAKGSKDISIAGLGAYAIVIKVGDLVVKVSSDRGSHSTFEIPYHPRILKPIIRKKDISTDYNRPLYIELQDEVDTNSRITNEELLKIYIELRKANIKGCDLTKFNVGRLKRPNVGYPIGYGPPSNNESLGLCGDDIPIQNVLQAGELVVFDLDYLYSANDEKAQFTQGVPDIIRRYEAEFVKKEKKTGKQDVETIKIDYR